MTEPTAQPAFDITEASAVVPEIDQQTRLSPGVQAQKHHLRQAQALGGQQTRLSPDIVAGQAGALRHDVGVISEDVERTHGDSLRIQLESRTDEALKRPPADLLSELADLGFSWTSIARLVGVSIPAVRKWRNGATVSGDNRRKVARLVALAGVLAKDHLIYDVASWLDIPLAETSLTGIDVLAAGRGHGYHHLTAYAAGHIRSSDLLDRTIPDWRSTLDDRFESYTAGDGEQAIRMRNDSSTQ